MLNSVSSLLLLTASSHVEFLKIPRKNVKNLMMVPHILVFFVTFLLEKNPIVCRESKG